MDSSTDGHHPRPSTSRGTQRLFIRLNTLYYLHSRINSLDKSFSPSSTSSPSHRANHRLPNTRRCLSSTPSYFELARSSIQSSIQHISEVAAYRLIFLDSHSIFYESLYVGDVANARIRPALRILKQNLTLLVAIVSDRAQPVAVKEVMKASFEAFLMVLLAGGTSPAFARSDYGVVVEDFGSLKRLFCLCGEGLVAEEVVEREAEVVQGVITLMGQSTDQLVEDFGIVSCEANWMGVTGGAGHKAPLPPTTG